MLFHLATLWAAFVAFVVRFAADDPAYCARLARRGKRQAALLS
jgi:hypothetical protein